MFVSRMQDRRMDSAQCTRKPGLSRLQSAALLNVFAILITVGSGCLNSSGSRDSGMFGKMTSMLSTDGIRGPLERSLYDENNVLELGRKYSPEAKAKVTAATAKFDRGEFKAAAKDFKSAAKKYKESSIGEEAQFRLAECYYAMGDYPASQDAFDQLFEDYPSTRYVEPATRRLFMIAKVWLEVADPVAKSEIRQASGEKVLEEAAPAKPSRDPTLIVRILPNFHDSSRPVFDTQGRALEALKAIWLNDPTGPLADDSLMLTATYYQRQDNYVEADRYFKILREEYPNSPHFEKAFILGSHVKLMSYQGPYYEGRELEAAQKLKEQSLHLFPASSTRTQTRKDLDKVYLMQAERAWSEIDYYRKKRRPRAVAIACIKLLNDYPDTQYAVEARRILQSVDRSELSGLPEEILQYLNNLPELSPARSSAEQPQVKSVSDSRAEPADEGRIRL